MQQVLTTIVILLLIAFMFVPMSQFVVNNDEFQNIKQSLNLSAKAVAECIHVTELNTKELSVGYQRSELSEVAVDKDKLLDEFYDVLRKNLADASRFDKVKSGLIVKVVVYHDRFFVADSGDRWSPPYFFTFESAAKGMVYLNSKDDKALYFKDNGTKGYTSISDPDINLSKQQKNDIIINRLNEILSRHAYAVLFCDSEENAQRQGLEIMIRNPEDASLSSRRSHAYFNVLDGVTFFVVYAKNEDLNIHQTYFNFTNYNVVGYTVE